MACVVMLVIILMSLVLGAELGPKADPTTTTYVPRPEWYFFFLFELLRVIKPAVADAAGDDRRPDDLHDPADPAAVLRPRPGAAARAAPDRDDRRHLHDRARWRYLTYLGAVAGSPNEIDLKVAKQYEAGQAGGRPVGLPGLPQDRRERQRRPRARPDRHRRQAAAGRDPAHAREPDGADALVRGPARGEEDRAGRLPRRSSRAESESAATCARPAAHRGHPRGGSGPGDVRPHRRRLRPDELGHDGRAAPPLARARGRPRAGRARATARSTSPPAPATWRSSSRARRPAARSSARTSPRGCSSGARTKAPRAAAGSGPTRSSCPTPTTRFDAATVGFGARNFSDLERGLARDGARRAPGRARRGARDHDADAAAAVDVLLALVRPRRAAARPLAAEPEAYTYLPELREALPRARRRSAARWRAPGCATCAGSSPRAASSRSTPARSALMASAPRPSPRSSRPAARTSRR